MNKVQLDYLLEKVKAGESATAIAKIIEAEHEAKIESAYGTVIIKSQAHLDAIMQILTEISVEGKQALEKARLE